MNEQELNKKLAKWAELKGLVYKIGVWHYWWYFDNNGREERLPDFTKDETACFKWLWHKAIALLNEKNQFALKESAYTYLFDRMREGMLDGIKPALALCLAIEKLIDKHS